MNAARWVLRAGALAITLGVGSGGATAVAGADAPDVTDPVGASADRGDVRGAAPDPRPVRDRRGDGAPRRATETARSAAAARPPSGQKPGAALVPVARPSAATAGVGDSEVSAAPRSTTPGAPRAVLGGASTPDGGGAPAVVIAPQQAVVAVPPVPAPMVPSPMVPAPMVPAPMVPAGLPTPAVAHRVPPAAAVRVTPPVVTRVLAALFGSTPGGTVDAPAAWAALAAARRQWGASGARTVLPTATTALVNQPPTITRIVLGQPNSSTGAVTGTVTATDPNADRITYRATTSTRGTVSITTAGVFTYTPSAAARHAAARLGATTAATTDTVTVTATDAKGAATRRAVTVPILGKNAAPTATKTVGVPNAGTGVVTGKVTGTDADRDPLTYTAGVTAKGTVSVTATTGAFTFTPTAAARHAAARIGAPAADKADTFTVTVSDGYGGSVAVPITVAISPANSAPTATATIAKPDPVSGVAKGSISAADTDKDALSFTASKPASGAVTFNGDGSFAYTPTAAARNSASTSATAKTDTFTVTVADGYGGSKAVSVTATIAPAYSAPPGGQLSTFCGCTLMPADTVFHADVSSLPVLAKSATWTTLLGGNLFAAWGGDQWMGNTAGMPVNTVGATRPGETVIFNRGYSTSGPSIDNTPYAIPDYPIVEGMPSAPAWDRHLLVFQEGTCISQELYNVANGVELPANGFGDALANGVYANTYGSTWIAEAGVHYDMNSPLYPAIGWANASQLPYLPLILRPDDLARGSIDHMLGITIAKDRGTGYTWPARAGDGTGTNPNGVPMGTVFRLRGDFDISPYHPSTRVILRALQQHGAVVYDSGNPGQNGATLLAMSNGWTGTGYLTAQQQLRTVPMSAFEAVDVLSLAADPAIGWAIRSTAAAPAAPAASVSAPAAPAASVSAPAASANAPAQAAAVAPVGEDYVLIRKAELMAKPSSGAGWAFVKSQADAAWETPDLSKLNTKTPAMVLAAGLLYARTGEARYRNRVIAAVKAVPGTETKAADVLPFARNVFGYVVAADLVDMPLDTVANNGQTWRGFLEAARTKQFPGNARWNSLEKTSGDSATNWNAYALSSHLAISVVLGDTAAVARDITIYRRFLGDIASPWPAFAPTAGYNWNGNGRTWDMSPTLQRGINPDKPGDGRSGAIILDAQRHSSLPSIRWGKLDLAGRAYTEETLDALLAINMVLRAQGSDFTDFQNQALRRAYAFLARNGGPSGYSNGRYLALAVNNLYGTAYSTAAGDSVARHLGFGGWLLKR